MTKANPHTRKMTAVTSLDGVIKKSRHEAGLAFDIWINIKGRGWDVALLNKVGKIGASIELTWGGWKTFIDRPHYEITTNQIDSFIIPKKEDDELVEKTTMKS